MPDSLAARLARVDAQIAEAALAVDRDPAELTRIVVTKFHPAQLVTELYRLGVRDFGENRQQDLRNKVTHSAELPDARWHFVGQVQTKKARAVRADAQVVHSVDRIRLVDALNNAAEPDTRPLDIQPLDILIQVNLTDDPARGGVVPTEVRELTEYAAQHDSLRVRGVMAVAPLNEPAAAAFERLAGCAQAVREVVPDARWMSAGMSTDFAEAIFVGATHLRIGTAITGPRPFHG